jgi:DNA-binding transcriptional regulator WhiA
MRSLAIEKLKEKLSLTPLQREVLIGLLLGDGHLETQNGRTYRLKIEQSKAHRAYVDHLYHLFEGWVLTPPRIKQVVSRGHASENVTFQTVSHSAFRFYAHQFYRDGRKQVPKLIHRWLTPRALSYWFMDDGSIKSKQSKGVILNTQAFQLADIERLIKCLHTKFDLQASIRKQREGCQIYISGNSFEKFSALVAAYVIPEMQYKLPLPRRTHLPKL